MMRYINLFERVCKVSTMNCFIYNGIIVFAVPKQMVFRAVGKNGENVKRLNEILRKKIKVVEASEDLSKFIAAVVDPVGFNKIEVRDGTVFITAGKQNKASLIGRNRQREQELEDILKQFFGIQHVRIL